MSMLKIHRSDEYYKYHFFNTDDLRKYGFEKACILANIEKYNNERFKEYHEVFPYIEKDKFYLLLQELIEEGLLISEKEISHD